MLLFHLFLLFSGDNLVQSSFKLVESFDNISQQYFRSSVSCYQLWMESIAEFNLRYVLMHLLYVSIVDFQFFLQLTKFVRDATLNLFVLHHLLG